ncbi:sugar ABC transporter substrate-binding protein [Microbacterium sp. ET2]|uniref:ABC transporter substrate-binding protein n=1 Tax=Microbacterium albipurpureum TaxID=3050384 RepID=UPI00259C6A40|nr:sugar ABC transporter substrate-binding protein [Microbacterium sp. ET2 (Ac-2212)]WJL96985.1 sugar ABC transporter substrate-binding protein [Microbacterium sp. ET2 (Ac-2212)]
MQRRIPYIAGALAIALASGLAGCSSGTPGEGASESTVDEITVWARGNALGEGLFTPLVDAWNETHDVEVRLTLVPSAELPAKLGAAAGAGEMPDVVLSDIGNLPSLVEQGVLQDLSDKIESLEYADALSPSAIEQGREGDALYAVPASVDPSLMYVNTSLLAQAGINEMPTSLDEVADAATAVRGLGDDTYGFYFAGSCGGCLAFTTDPVVWADGGEIVADDGNVVIDTPEMASALQFYRGMWESGTVQSDAPADTGANWANVFAPGNIGIQFNGSSLLGALSAAEVPFEWDVAAIPGPGGGESSFIGGDTFSVTKDAQNVDAAWEFIEWALDEQQQIDIYAANGWLTVRTDLTDNEFTAADPRVKKVNDLISIGQTPRTPYSGQIFNDPTGPWLATFRAAVLNGDDIDAALAEGQDQIDQIQGG